MMDTPTMVSTTSPPAPDSSVFSAARNSYPSDVSDPQWTSIAALLPPPAGRGRKRSVDYREVVNGINFRWTTGCTWRMLPHDLPPWKTVFNYYRAWQVLGLLPKIRKELVRRRRRPRTSQRTSPDFCESTRPVRETQTSLSPAATDRLQPRTPDRH